MNASTLSFGLLREPEARPVEDELLRAALEQERAAVFWFATWIRAVGAALIFIQVLACWLATRDMGWFVYLSPLAAYTLCALALTALHNRVPGSILSWTAAVLDVGGIFVMQRLTMPVSPFPAGVAGFSLGLFALVLVLGSLCLRPMESVVAAAAASVCQCALMAMAHVSVGPRVIAVTTLFLVVWACHAGLRRIRLMASRILRAEAARLSEARRADALTQARDQIQLMLAEAEERNAAMLRAHQDRDALAQLLVHDLRNPLTTLSLSLETLESHLKSAEAPPLLQTALTRSVRSTHRLGGMVSDLLDVARLEGGQLEPKRAQISVKELVPDTWELNDKRDGFAEHSLELEPGLEVFADLDLMTRVVENLLVNAARYTGPKHHILLRAQSDANEIIISVHNDGPAIPPTTRTRLFERFTRGAGETHRGWGLGLYFCRLALDAHGGRIAIEDVPGWPVSFVVRLPKAGESERGEGANGVQEIAHPVRLGD